MKKFLFVSLFAFSFLFVNDINAQDYKTALGVRLSSAAANINNSISIKHFINEKTAIEGLFSFGDPLAFGALVEFHKPLASEGLRYYYKFANIPLNISLDWKPELNIVSDINFEPAAIGFTARFTFSK